MEKNDHYPEFDFIQNNIVNKLAENGINQLKFKITELAVLEADVYQPRSFTLKEQIPA